MLPRQRLPKISFATAVKIRVNAARRKSLRPRIGLEHVGPAVELRAELPRRLNHPRKFSVATRQRTLKHAQPRVVVVVGYRLVANQIFQQRLPPLEFRRRNLRRPLKRSKRLRHETRDAHRDFDVAAIFYRAVQVDDLLRKLGNARNVRVSFRRQAHHEIQLDGLPALGEGGGARVKQILFGYVLVDDVAQTLRAGFGREGQPALSDGLDAFGKLNRKAVDTQARQGKAHLLGAEVALQIVNQSRQAGVIGTA